MICVKYADVFSSIKRNTASTCEKRLLTWRFRTTLQKTIVNSRLSLFEPQVE